MRFKKPILAKTALWSIMAAWLVVATAWAAPVREEHVTNGNLDLVWAPGFGVTANMMPLTLDPSHPAYGNPSGDHTVANATNMPPDSGGIVLTCTDPAGLSDYSCEGWIFTGDGNTRRGLVVRGDPNNGFASCYQLVIQSGLLQMNFRKLVNGMPTTLGTWFTNTVPGGTPAQNSWHHMKITAIATTFRCFWDGTELTTTPILDGDLTSGWVGVYNFRFDLGGIPFLTDDLLLSPEAGSTPVKLTTWGKVKAIYR
jgi:hypothetical protein